jgi:hypothetical protein
MVHAILGFLAPMCQSAAGIPYGPLGTSAGRNKVKLRSGSRRSVLLPEIAPVYVATQRIVTGASAARDFHDPMDRSEEAPTATRLSSGQGRDAAHCYRRSPGAGIRLDRDDPEPDGIRRYPPIHRASRAPAAGRIGGSSARLSGTFPFTIGVPAPCDPGSPCASLAAGGSIPMVSGTPNMA